MQASQQKLISLDKIKTIQVDPYQHPDLAESIMEEHRNQLLKREIKLRGETTVHDYLANDGKSFIAIPKMKRPYFWEFKKRKLYKRECELILKKFKEWTENEDKV